jgi:MFS family permease
VEKMSELKECNGNIVAPLPERAKGKELEHDLSKWNRNIWKIYMFKLFMGFHMIAGVLIPFFLTWGKLTFFEVMILQSYFTTMILLLEIPCGAIADYINRKFSLLLGAFSTALAALIYATYPNIIIFIIGETLFAFGNSLISGSDQAILYDTLRKIGKEKEITRISARSKGFFLFGITISAPLGSLIGTYLSLSLTMSFMFFPFIIATFISVTLKEPNHDLERKESESYFKVIQSGFKELIKNPILRVLAVDLVITESAVFFMFWTYQLYLEDLNFSLVFFGFIAASMTITELVFTNIVPKFEKRFKNKKRFLQIYTLVPGIAYIFMATIFITPVSIALILIVIGFGFSRSILFIHGINKHIKTENRATVLSTINMIASLIHTILYPVIGFLVMWSLSLTFIVLGAIITLSALLSRVKTEYLK